MMKVVIPYRAVPVAERTSPRPVCSAVEATLHILTKHLRWWKGALGTIFLFAFSYLFVTSLSNASCSTSSIAGFSSREADSNLCRFASWFGAFFEPESEVHAPRAQKVHGAPSCTVEHNGSECLETRTSIDRIVFGIGANIESWSARSEYIKLWWKPGVTRGFAWTDENVTTWKEGDPPYKISEDISRFTNPEETRSSLRISRIVSESFRLGLPNVDWFVMGDDDTLFFTENLVSVLSKYDPRKMHYVGTNSEDTRQSERHLYGLGFGGGGFAISYPLAKALADTQDDCLERYSFLYGSDERVKACVSELGVPLTKELGFHQLDIRGDISGFLAAHPVAPIVSLHHLDDIEPIFYGMSQLDAAKRLMAVENVDAGSLFQQSICYDSEKRFSFSVSWGYVVEVYQGFLTPRELEIPARTFVSWAGRNEFGGFTMDTREFGDVCDRPTRFFMTSARKEANGRRKLSISDYEKLEEFQHENCIAKMAQMATVQSVNIENESFSDDWYQNPERHCCTVRGMNSKSISIWVGVCGDSESLVAGAKPAEAGGGRMRRLLTERN